MALSLSTEPVPAPVQQLLTLFTGPLHDVRFPGIDAEVLEQLRQDVLQHAERVETQRHAWEAAKQALESEQKRLTETAERALAYAKIFAQSDTQLQDALGQIEAAWGQRAPARVREGKKSGRRKGGAAESAQPAGLELPLDAVAPEAPMLRDAV